MSLATLARAHWRTALGAAVGAAGGAAYAHFIGCHTGTCALTSNAWTAAVFFGFTGAVMATPSRRSDRDRAAAADEPAAPRADEAGTR